MERETAMELARVMILLSWVRPSASMFEPTT
jgi:hypothetical protein